MSVMRVVLICAIFLFLFFFAGGPLIGLAVSSITFLVPSFLILAVVGLAAWKTWDLVKR